MVELVREKRERQEEAAAAYAAEHED